MTREEEIENYLQKIGKGEFDAFNFDIGFESGVEWADAHPHWISVDDELPKEDGMYIFLQSGIIYTAMYYKSIGLHRDVTHWMPLPQAPILANFAKTCKNLKGGAE